MYPHPEELIGLPHRFTVRITDVAGDQSPYLFQGGRFTTSQSVSSAQPSLRCSITKDERMATYERVSSPVFTRPLFRTASS